MLKLSSSRVDTSRASCARHITMPLMKKPVSTRVAAAGAASHPTIDDAEFLEWDPAKISSKIEVFRSGVSAAGLVESQLVLSEYFTKKQMNHLWKYFERKELTSATPEAKKAWTGIKATSKTKNKDNHEVLTVAIAFPNQWQRHITTITNKVSAVQEETMERKRWYKGELQVKHGHSEAQAMIDKGKYEEAEDSDGDTCYYKVEKTEKFTKQKINTADVVQSCDTDKDTSENLASLMLSDGAFDHMNLETPTWLKKRPAAAKAIGRQPKMLKITGHNPEPAPAPQPAPKPTPPTPEQKAKQVCKTYLNQLNAKIPKVMSAVESLKRSKDASSLLQKAKEVLGVCRCCVGLCLVVLVCVGLGWFVLFWFCLFRCVLGLVWCVLLCFGLIWFVLM